MVVISKVTRNNRVYIVDDDEPARLSLAALLSAHKIDVEPAATAAEFLDHVDLEAALCAFIDIRMPGMNGMELQRTLLDRGIDIPVIILTAHGDVPLAVEAMKRGALDFIEKPASEKHLLGAIASAAQRLSGRQPLTSIQREIASKRLARLTGREKEVLDHLILGMTSKHIAEELGISQRTIEIHRARIREKLEARGLADLIRIMK
jgi:RNA polymerase sigma factor (sigma-70 family)